MEISELLERKAALYNSPDFIEDDPVSIPHLFTKKEDIEIMGFWSAILAWGQRKTIINKSKELINLMDGAPHDFVINHKPADLKRFFGFKHRTFNDTDALYFLSFFQDFYKKHKSLEEAFISGEIETEKNTEPALIRFRDRFFSMEFIPRRTLKHVASPLNRSTCKRLNMFLRWMVRDDQEGVDLGIWKRIDPSQLIAPMDVHVNRVARKLGLIDRKQNDWQAALELTDVLRSIDPQDPVKFDFALFGMGRYEHY